MNASETKQNVCHVSGHCLYVQLSDLTGNDLGAALLKEGHAKHVTDSSSITSLTTSSTGLSSSSPSLTTSSSTDSFSSVATVTSTSSSSSVNQASTAPTPESTRCVLGYFYDDCRVWPYLAVTSLESGAKLMSQCEGLKTFLVTNLINTSSYNMTTF